MIHILDEHNELVRLFRTARDKYCNEEDVPDFKIGLFNVFGPREYQLPSAEILGAIVFEPGPNSQIDYDVIIQKKKKKKERIHKELTNYIHHTCHYSYTRSSHFSAASPSFSSLNRFTLTVINAPNKLLELTPSLHPFSRFTARPNGGDL